MKDVYDFKLKENHNEQLDEIINKAHLEILKTGLNLQSGAGDVKSFFNDDLNVFSIVDLTNLKPSSTTNDISELCTNAIKNNTKAVCVHSFYLEQVVNHLNQTSVLPICVAGFPLGMTRVDILINEIKVLLATGAKEIDIVFPSAFIKEKNYNKALYYISKIRENTSCPLKVILETSDNTKIDIAIMALICKEALCDFVKTSTGFSKSGATTFDVALMRRAVGNKIGVKASGGIRDISTAKALIQVGATRIGTSGLERIDISGNY